MVVTYGPKVRYCTFLLNIDAVRKDVFPSLAVLIISRPIYASQIDATL